MTLDARHHQFPFGIHGSDCRMDDGRACTCKEPYPMRPSQAAAWEAAEQERDTLRAQLQQLEKAHVQSARAIRSLEKALNESRAQLTTAQEQAKEQR